MKHEIKRDLIWIKKIRSNLKMSVNIFLQIDICGLIYVHISKSGEQVCQFIFFNLKIK